MAGRGVRKNRTLAVEWLQRAASHGDEYAMHALGTSYRYGQGVSKNPNKGFELQLEVAGKGES